MDFSSISIARILELGKIWETQRESIPLPVPTSKIFLGVKGVGILGREGIELWVGRIEEEEGRVDEGDNRELRKEAKRIASVPTFIVD